MKTNSPIFHEDNNGIFLEKQYIRKPSELIQVTNFRCNINEFFTASNSYKKIQIVRFECISNFGIFQAEINVNDVPKFNPSELDGRLYIAAEKHLKDMFIIYFRELLAMKTPSRKFLVEHLGDNIINGCHVYIAGNLLLGSDINIEDIYLDNALSKFIVKYNQNITEIEAFEWFGNFCAIEHGCSEFIGLNTLQSYIEPIYAEARIPNDATVIIVGDSQTKKTTLTQLGTTLYNMDANHPINTIRFDSSITAIQKHLSFFKTTCAILDDFFRNTTDMRGQTKTLQTIMRQKADNIIRKTMNTDFDITRTQIFITSESLLDNISDLGRMQVLMLSDSINSMLLTPVQKNQDKLIAFYVHFIDWAYRNYDSLLAFSKIEFAKFQMERQSNSCRWSRLHEHTFTTKLTLKIMLKYADDMNIVSKEEINNIEAKFEKIIDKQQERQTAIMEQIAKRSGEEVLDIPRAIWYLIKNEIFEDWGYQSKCFFSYVEDVQCLWITTDFLLYELNNVFDFRLTVKKVLKCLQEINALITDERGNKNTKRHNNRRYAVIRLDALDYYIHSDTAKYVNRF